MAGDIFFTESRAWSSNTNGFLDIINRAISRAYPADASIVRCLSIGAEIRLLDIDTQVEQEHRLRLTELVLQSAADALAEAIAERDCGQVNELQELIATAQLHLRDLKSTPL